MYGAGADNDNYPLVLAGKDACGVVAGGGDGESGFIGGSDLVPEQGGLDEGVVLAKEKM